MLTAHTKYLLYISIYANYKVYTCIDRRLYPAGVVWYGGVLGEGARVRLTLATSMFATSTYLRTYNIRVI